jgi:hypothetical protein
MEGQQCMIFWYHMFGSDMGQLQIYVNNTRSLRPLWFKAGNQGNKWHKAQISIWETGEYQVIKTQTQSYFYSSVALHPLNPITI